MFITIQNNIQESIQILHHQILRNLGPTPLILHEGAQPFWLWQKTLLSGVLLPPHSIIRLPMQYLGAPKINKPCCRPLTEKYKMKTFVYLRQQMSGKYFFFIIHVISFKRELSKKPKYSFTTEGLFSLDTLFTECIDSRILNEIIIQQAHFKSRQRRMQMSLRLHWNVLQFTVLSPMDYLHIRIKDTKI